MGYETGAGCEVVSFLDKICEIDTPGGPKESCCACGGGVSLSVASLIDATQFDIVNRTSGAVIDIDQVMQNMKVRSRR